MNKLFIPLLLAMGLGSLIGCSSELDSPRSDRAVYTTPDVSSMPRLQRYIERLFAKQYNVNITYTWDQKATDSRFLLAPITEAKALEYLNLIDYAFFQVYAVAAPEGYLQTHTVKSLNLFGSSGYGMDRRMLGAAPQGEIWIYKINELDVSDLQTTRDDYISTLYHESAHTLHEERAYPAEFNRLSALEYQRQDAFSYWWRTNRRSDYAGFVSDYGSTDSDEDFAELFSIYILDTDGAWQARLKAAEGKNRPEATMTGRQIIERKLEILKEYLRSEYSTDLDSIKAEAQRRLVKISTMDFTQYPSGY